MLNVYIQTFDVTGENPAKVLIPCLTVLWTPVIISSCSPLVCPVCFVVGYSGKKLY
jgi:hypothetical protein